MTILQKINKYIDALNIDDMDYNELEDAWYELIEYLSMLEMEEFLAHVPRVQ